MIQILGTMRSFHQCKTNGKFSILDTVVPSASCFIESALMRHQRWFAFELDHGKLQTSEASLLQKNTAMFSRMYFVLKELVV